MHHILINPSAPPPSPTRWIKVVPPPREHGPSPLEGGPASKKRKRRKKGNRSDPVLDALPSDVPMVEMNHPVEPVNNNDYSAENTFSNILDNDSHHPVSAETRSCNQLMHGDEDHYMRYIDAVMADDAPFYQVSADIFVVSGWDVQERCNNVRSSYLFSLRVKSVIPVSAESMVSSANDDNRHRRHCSVPLPSSDDDPVLP